MITMEGHFGLAGAYQEDPGAALQRWHRERIARTEREERCEKWIAAKLVGQSFSTLAELTFAAVAVTETFYGRKLTSEEHELIQTACRSLASGLTLIATIAPTRCLVDRETLVIRFLAA